MAVCAAVLYLTPHDMTCRQMHFALMEFDRLPIKTEYSVQFRHDWS